MKTSPFVKFAVVGFIFGMVFLGAFSPKTINADYEKEPVHVPKVAKTIKMVITAYSSTPEQTDDTPFITASGSKVRDGIIANNLLPFGTRVRIPKLYGDKIFTVEDRMHRRKGNYHADIWFAEYKDAKKFGVAMATIEVLED